MFARCNWPDHEIRCKDGKVFKVGHPVQHKKYGLGYVVIFDSDNIHPETGKRIPPVWCVEYVSRKKNNQELKRLSEGYARATGEDFSEAIAKQYY